MTRRIQVAAALSTIGLLASACGGGGSSGGTNADSKDPVKLAIVEPFSGSFGYFGDFLKNSLQYQVDKINADGGLLGHQLEVITRDDQLQAQPTVTAVRELAGDPSVGLVVGPSFTFLYNAVRSIYEQEQKLNCPVSVDSSEAIEGAKYGFRAGPYNKLSNNALLGYFQESGAVETIGLIYSDDATGQGIDTELKKLAPKYDLEYLGAEFYNPGASNQLAQFNALSDADAIYISSNGADAAQSAISATQIDYQGILVGNDGLQSYAFVDGAGERAAGSIFASEPLFNMTNQPPEEWPAAYREFVETATEQYGVQTGPKSGVTQLKATPLATACVVAWSKAVEKAGTFDATKVAEAWEKLTVPAEENPAAIPLSFSEGNHDFFRSPDQMAVYQWVHDGDKWYLKTLRPPKQ